MKRSITIEIERCLECPNSECIDGFASHHYYCPLIGKCTNENYGYNSDEIYEELTNWFENDCTLNKVDKE